MGGEFFQRCQREVGDAVAVPVGQQLRGCKADVAPQCNQLQVSLAAHLADNLVHGAVDLAFHNLPQLTTGGAVSLQRFPQPERAQPIRVRRNYVPRLQQQHLGAAASHLGDQGARLLERRLPLEQRLNAQVGHAVDVGFVQGLDVKPGGDVNAVDERQPVRRLAHGTGGHHANALRIGNAVFLENAAIAL